MLNWTKQKPQNSGWYWVSPDPKEKPYGIFRYDPDVFGLTHFLMKTNEEIYFAGPIPEPPNKSC